MCICIYISYFNIFYACIVFKTIELFWVMLVCFFARFLVIAFAMLNHYDDSRLRSFFSDPVIFLPFIPKGRS